MSKSALADPPGGLEKSSFSALISPREMTSRSCFSFDEAMEAADIDLTEAVSDILRCLSREVCKGGAVKETVMQRCEKESEC